MWLYKIVRGQCTDDDYNKEMNALFVKLHLLDPQSVIPAFQFLINQRGTSALHKSDSNYYIHVYMYKICFIRDLY